jgi:hypothetical protein
MFSVTKAEKLCQLVLIAACFVCCLEVVSEAGCKCSLRTVSVSTGVTCMLMLPNSPGCMLETQERFATAPRRLEREC